MNEGEKDELLFKIQLVYMRDNDKALFGEKLTSVGFKSSEYKTIPKNINLSSLKSMSDSELKDLSSIIGISKASTGCKADVYINGIGVSLKSLQAAPAALVNHTARPGFEFACKNANVDIETLDEIVNHYWELRMNGKIAEDIRNSDIDCPFKDKKDYMKPILEYFLFVGSGRKISIAPAEYIIEFLDPLNPSTYKKLTKKDAVEEFWPNLTFSIRAKKGMPKNYKLESYNGRNAASIAKWVRFFSGDYRGALHIRISKGKTK